MVKAGGTRDSKEAVGQWIQEDNLQTTGLRSQPWGGEIMSLMTEFKCPVFKAGQSRIFAEIFLACQTQIHLATSLVAAG